MTEVTEIQFDRTRPALPNELLQFPLDEIDIMDFPRKLEELWDQILEELCDQRWMTRAHDTTGTYNKGCHGPLCRKALRNNVRRKNDQVDTLRMSTYLRLDPITEYYHMIAKLRLTNYRRERLLAIQAG